MEKKITFEIELSNNNRSIHELQKLYIQNMAIQYARMRENLIKKSIPSWYLCICKFIPFMYRAIITKEFQNTK